MPPSQAVVDQLAVNLSKIASGGTAATAAQNAQDAARQPAPAEGATDTGTVTRSGASVHGCNAVSVGF